VLQNQLVDLRKDKPFEPKIKGPELESSPQKDTTDLSMFVRTSSDDMVAWNREKIVDALIRETGLKKEIAVVIGVEVEKQIKTLGVEVITSPLIRELVDVKLLEYGLEEVRRSHTRLGVPIFDVRRILFHRNKENANTPHNPVATNLTLAQNIKKEFALLQVFSLDVADAHMRGDMHIHDLGFIDRPYCSGQSPEFIKKFGLSLPDAKGIAKPANGPEEFITQLVKFSVALHGHFAGAIGWDAINVFVAPYLEGYGRSDVKRIAKLLINEFAQQALAGGGQSLFSDLNIYFEIPKHFESVQAIGRGGEYTGRKYGDYIKEAQLFAECMFEVYKEGDGMGRPYFFPKPLVHITDKFFETPDSDRFLYLISEVAADKGNTYYVFDRGETAKISECCRLSFKLEKSDLLDAEQPWKMRYSAVQNVTLNLPRLAYLAKGSEEELFKRIESQIEVAVKAHMQKRAFIEQLLATGNEGPLSLLAAQVDGEAYLRLHRATHLIGILGLNELVQFHTGSEMHESEEALKLGLKVIAFMKLKCEESSKKHKINFVLEQTPAESAAYRLAKLDMKNMKSDTERVIKGNGETGEIYYTNSTYFNVSRPMNPIDRVVQEGLFHPLIDAGALTHVWLGESMPSSSSIANFVIKTFKNTQNSQIAFSPEFTSCNSCGKTSRGLKDSCPSCSSSNVEGITRVTGYFSKVPGWNKGKLGELKDRYRSGGHFESK